MIKHGMIKGHVVESFETESKWFDPPRWYKKTCWGERYPEYIYFQEDDHEIDCSLFSPTFDKRAEELAKQYAIPANKILDAIIREVNDKCKLNYEYWLPNTNKSYGDGWWEAEVPLMHNGEYHLLTWQNCD
jgi:hypothetical protein